MEDKKENGGKRSVNVTYLESKWSQQKYSISSGRDAQECEIDPMCACVSVFVSTLVDCLCLCVCLSSCVYWNVY